MAVSERDVFMICSELMSMGVIAGCEIKSCEKNLMRGLDTTRVKEKKIMQSGYSCNHTLKGSSYNTRGGYRAQSRSNIPEIMINDRKSVSIE